MITGEIKNKVDKMWEYFWTGGLTNPVDVIEQLTYLIFIKQCKNTRDSSTRRVLVMRHVLVGYELHEDFSKHIGKLVCRHGAKPCNKETELLGTLKASITTTQYLNNMVQM